jgi:hypothetical protein
MPPEIQLGSKSSDFPVISVHDSISEEKMLNTKGHKKKKICLIDVDSYIPNLALMKISYYFRSRGFEISLIKLNYTGYDHYKREKKTIDASEFDKVFVSTIFTLNQSILDVKNCKEVYLGGTGYDYTVKMPIEIEHLYPDYELYSDNQYSIGYLTRGCIRDCKYCFIPKKEGKLTEHSPLEEFYNPKLPKIMLLDNNILALPDSKCVLLLKQLEETGKRVTFKQGLDFRLLTKEKAEQLAKLKYDGEYIFAFDQPKDKPIIERNLKNIWRPLIRDWKTKFFVLIGYDSTLEEDLDRVYFLRKNKCLPYIMRHSKCYNSENRPFYTDLASWCNQPGLFKYMSFREFLKKRHCTKEDRKSVV